MLRYLLAWIVMAGIAIANGALRESTFGKRMTELRAHQLSTLVGSVAIGAFVWLVVRIWPPESDARAWEIGAMWLALTLAFEFTMGIAVMKKSLRQALADYDLRRGRVWPVFLAWITVAPWLFHRLS